MLYFRKTQKKKVSYIMENKSATSGLVMSIVGLALGVLAPYISFGSLAVATAICVILNLAGIALSIVGTVSSAKAKKALKAANAATGSATAGLVIGIIGIVMGGLTFFTCSLCAICVCAAGEAIEEGVNGALNNLK